MWESFVRELAPWVSLAVRWEVAVIQWKALGRGIEFPIIVCLIVNYAYIGICFGFFDGLFRFLRWAARQFRIIFWRRGWWPKGFPRPNGNRRNSLPIANRCAAWLATRHWETVGRYLPIAILTVIFVLSVTPLVPWVEATAIVIARTFGMGWRGVATVTVASTVKVIGIVLYIYLY